MMLLVLVVIMFNDDVVAGDIGGDVDDLGGDHIGDVDGDVGELGDNYVDGGWGCWYCWWCW